ncbi:MAG: AAA family ATPase, partial [Planctomycetes bacterium]|nr:AAA family ATPase [Planctomycetota bacterium]
MYLKKVELSGFKSFADKTVFDFDEGITAILGPNGCGKSNVVDAIKWVLGETSAKNLRGQQMQDVIFAGSERRKPVGFAEVHLHFDNSDGSLPVEFNEVCITRRLFRSGESEYLINKQPCRKRDIRDMLMDTGVGTSAYSVIEQGKVEALLQAKPNERRLVFEEAAGISKYKQRRKETLARLERTNQYLFRVNDIVEEVEKNIRRVGRQAASARRFQKLKSELDLLKTH